MRRMSDPLSRPVERRAGAIRRPGPGSRDDRDPAVAVVLAFVDRINQADVDGLGRLMTGDHVLRVFDEAPLEGRDANVAAWRGYAGSWPNYRIHPHRVAASGDRVAVLGHTTDSHLGLPPAEESATTLIWVAEVSGSLVRSWTLVEDTGPNRSRLGLG